MAATPPREARRPGLRLMAGVTAVGLLAGCSSVSSGVNSVLGLGGSTGPTQGQAGFVRGFLGQVVTDEPRAAVVAREILSAGGSAQDAAVAASFTLAVTLPSRAGLGGGGACLVYDQRRREAEAVIFPAGARTDVAPGADRPAAIPMYARGLFAVHVRGGRLPFEQLIAPAEQSARFGTEVSRALAADLAVAGTPLVADPWSRQSFGTPDGRPLAEGARMQQPDLASTLAALRTAGVGDMYQGGLARRIEDVSPVAGAGLTAAEMRAGLPRIVPSLDTPGIASGDRIHWLPTDGGLAAAATFRALQGGATPQAAAETGLRAARALRIGGGDPAAILASTPAGDGAFPSLPASTSLVVMDREGGAVACAFSLNNLFGTGRVAQGLGFLFGAAPGIGSIEPPLLPAAIVTSSTLRAFRAAAAGSGQFAAPLAVAGPLREALRGVSVPDAVANGVSDPGRASLAGCSRYLPGAPETCRAASDPRGFGVALGTLE
ncbi:gamma-glutamyltransferase [Humitalea sp. 24SJ18S-53]|uniref:gamma-glutamyltransferase n=1 Tax=Humitalea sp. 24SJ18S-53 TaxID=3422307 RepID=UPI003D66E1BA